MTSMQLSPYENDMAQQGEVMRIAAAAPIAAGLRKLDLSRFDRIILTGMGSSDSVAIPFEMALARQGLPVWRIQTSTLLDMPQLIAGRTLLWVTSQSGKSGEVVALLARIPRRSEVVIVATTNDPRSPLGLAADYVVELLSGAEATVSCKSYMNSLAWYHRLANVFTGGSDEAAAHEILETATSLTQLHAMPATVVDALAGRSISAPAPCLALVGTGADAATALAGALILKEACKLPAEGFAGGSFRHGPMEIARDGTTVLMFGAGSADPTIRNLASDLSRTGCIAVTVTADAYAGAEHLAISARSQFDRLAHGMSIVQQLSVGLATRHGMVPGEFRFGQKITSQL